MATMEISEGPDAASTPCRPIQPSPRILNAPARPHSKRSTKKKLMDTNTYGKLLTDEGPFTAVHATTKPDESKKKRTAKVARIRRNGIADLWAHIKDILTPVDMWPKGMRLLFWKEPRYQDRLTLMCFAWVNGLDPELLIEWFRITGKLYKKDREQHFRSILKVLKTEPLKYKWWAYCLHSRRREFMDGSYCCLPKRIQF